MKALVYGAGIIGCYLTHMLSLGGNEVTLLARGKWKDTLSEHGLEIRHHLQRKTTLDRPRVIGEIDDTRYDAVFAVMPMSEITAILPALARVRTPLVVMVGNNTRAEEMRREILELAGDMREVLFAFQVTAGRKEEERVVVERFGASGLDIGALHGEVSEKARETLTALFSGTGYALHWQEDMEAYLFCHPAAVLPIAYLAYACGGDLRRSTRQGRRDMLDAAREAYAVLSQLGIPILPKGDERFFTPGPKRTLMSLLYFIMAKSVIGDLVACEHCRHAVKEMEMLSCDFEKLLAQKPDASLTAWHRLKDQMPSWEELHARYDGR